MLPGAFPFIGIGTYRIRNEIELDKVIQAAHQVGITAIDTADIYRNAHLIKKAMAKLSIDRSQMHITSKISPYQHGFRQGQESIDKILKELDTDYLDLLLIHWPGTAGKPQKWSGNPSKRLQTWRAMEQAYEAGKVKALGVSNYTISHLEDLLENAVIKPVVNQFECHPRLPQTELRAFCLQRNIHVTAYASLGVGDLCSNPTICEMAALCSRTPSQILLKWAMQKGMTVIPKSCRPERIREFGSYRLSDWTLDEYQMQILDDLRDDHRYCWNPIEVS